jgi:hypothetical protein
MRKRNSVSNGQLPFTFGTNFLKDYAGHIITDPRVAVIELIANSYDAGATRVDVGWPDAGQIFSISDNGIGMTGTEFSPPLADLYLRSSS